MERMTSSYAIYLVANNVFTLFYARCVLGKVFLQNSVQRDSGVKKMKNF